jgi:nucleoside-diphosphate-sugar epimerase
VVFREFVGRLLATQGLAAPMRTIPTPVAAALASAGETAWRLLPLPGRPPLTRFAYWVSAEECTIRIDKARAQLGYQPPKSIDDGFAELEAQ